MAKLRKSGLSVPPALEALEERVLFSTFEITKVIADNRGTVNLVFNEIPDGINKQNVEIFTAGPSGNPANSDHIQQKVSLTTVDHPPGFIAPTVTVATKTSLSPGTRYEVVVKAAVTDDNGNALDGEFKGATTPSGNGVAGGAYRFVTGGESQKTAIFSTQFGQIYVNLVPKASAPATVKNFLKYANAGAWDGTFFNRLTNVTDNGTGTIQGGSFIQTGTRQLGAIADLTNPSTGIPLELNTGLSNGTIGTLSMFHGAAPNSATNTFFFNYASDPSLDTQNGGYSAFGEIASTDTVSMDILALALGELPTVNISNRQAISGLPAGKFTEVPTNFGNFSGPPTASDVVTDLADELAVLYRVSIEMSASAAVQTAFADNVPNIPVTLAADPIIFSPDIIADSSVFGQNQIVSGSDIVTDNSGTSTTTDSYENGVLVSSTTTSTPGSEDVTGTLILTQNNPESTVQY